MVRTALAGPALLALVLLGGSRPTLATLADTRANSASATTQAVFPPLNSVPPAITRTIGGGQVTSLSAGQSLTASRGTWTTSHSASTTYAYQWQRCASGACSDIAGSTLQTYVVAPQDTAGTLRVLVTGTDSDASVTPRKATTAASPEVP